MVSRCGGFGEWVGFASRPQGKPSCGRLRRHSRRVRLRRTALRAAPLFLLEL